MNRPISLLAVFSLLPSCASIVSKSVYPVTITSTPPGAKVSISDAKNQVIHTGVTPSVVSLRSSQGYFRPAAYNVAFSKAGSSPQTVPLNASINGWYAGNIIAGGLIGMLIVDPLTGAMWRLPDTVSASLPRKN